ncbi:MAG: hypothetical protein IPF96_03920 [Rhodobacter sp.]|nr:hypothetical protein [Rhodobacter sp.]
MSLFSLLAEVLFVGHSLIGPTLPNLVEAGLAQMGQPAEVEAQIINGAPLAYAWDHSSEAEGVDGRKELARGEVTALVLTEAIPLAGQVQWNDSAGLVARWAGAARAGNPRAKVWVYETWHSLASGTGAEVPDDPGATVPWRQRIDDDLPLWLAVAGDNAGIIPAGQAMGLLADEIAAGQVPGISDIREMFGDDIHPNGKGLYFLAMVHLAVLAGKSPEGLPPRLTRAWPSRDSILTEAQAAALQRIAWAAVQGFAEKAAAARAAMSGPAQDATATPTKAAAADPPPAAADRVAPPMPAFAPVTNPNLTIGLAGVNDWSVQQPFLDLMKTARPWVGHLPDQWGGWQEADLRGAGALDADGWPLRIPAEVTGLSTLILTDLPEDAASMAGRYVLTHDGQGDLALEGLAAIIETGPGRIVFDYAPGTGAVILTLTAIDPADPIRSISVVRADRAAALAAGKVFNPDWLERIRGVKGIRFMDWMATNDSTLSGVVDRPKVADYSWARNGVPVEVMVALANELQAEPWLTLPHAASDGLVQAYAAVVRDGLDPGLRVWVEYSNEVWNWQFQQAHWAEAMGKERWGQDGTWLQFYGQRAAEVMAVFSAEMGDPARVVRVISTQTGAKGVEEQILMAPLAVAEGQPPPVESFDAYAVTGYFSGLLGAEHKLPWVQRWVAESEQKATIKVAEAGLTGPEAEAYLAAHRYDLAVDRAVAELRNGLSSGTGEDTLEQLLTDTLPWQAAVAARHGLTLAMYEGGTHVVGYGPAVEDEALAGFFIVLNYSDGMGALYGDLLAGWAGLSDQPFNAFVDVYRPNKWGSWGALRHLGDDNPRWRALARGCDGC